MGSGFNAPKIATVRTGACSQRPGDPTPPEPLTKEQRAAKRARNKAKRQARKVAR